ncbi:hypothetical protein FBEOM_9539 [Fusarium beomiforme]|uniref:Uncharacterized protein n=1 Tax=Fusarium beomiforme TaxID=44412 RepID=A0A9P5AD93_9HYPO|nr:hypothetical protein FBEOM_9539 [Fusarium beomiforme]
MGRRDTYSEPPRSHRQSRRQPPPRRGPSVKQSESGFDWTPGIVLALLGAFTWLSHDFDNYKKKHEQYDDRRGDQSRDSERGRRKHRSSSRIPDQGYDDYGCHRGRAYSR